MWRELGLATAAPASAEDLQAAEGACGCPLPPSLLALLRETDGLEGEYGLEVVFSAARDSRIAASASLEDYLRGERWHSAE